MSGDIQGGSSVGTREKQNKIQAKHGDAGLPWWDRVGSTPLELGTLTCCRPNPCPPTSPYKFLLSLAFPCGESLFLLVLVCSWILRWRCPLSCNRLLHNVSPHSRLDLFFFFFDLINYSFF